MMATTTTRTALHPRLALATAAACAWLAISLPGELRAEASPDGGAVATSTIARSLTPEELELARYYDLLVELDVLEDLDCLELLPLLEDAR